MLRVTLPRIVPAAGIEALRWARNHHSACVAETVCYQKGMAEFSTLMLLAIAATFLAAGLVKGVTGMGLPTVAMAVLGALVSPLAAASLLVVPSFVTNVWQFLAGPAHGAVLRRLWQMMLATFAGTALSAGLLVGGETGATTTALGLALVVYAAYTLFARQLHVHPRLEPWLSPVTGAVTGLVTGGTGILVVPTVPYLQALGLPREHLIQALGLSFTVSTLALATGLGARGAFTLQSVGLSALAVLPALVGMWAGQKLRGRIDPALFRRLFLISLLLLGAEMALRPLR